MSVNVTDPKAARRLPFAAPNPLFLRDEELTRGIELLEQAHQALIAEPERALTGLALARSHWRVLHAIGRHPGITMVELQGSVPLTKQSLSRLLKELVVTDSIEASDGVTASEKVRIVSCAPLIGEAIRRIANEESVSKLFD